jgi:hypothetical protein
MTCDNFFSPRRPLHSGAEWPQFNRHVQPFGHQREQSFRLTRETMMRALFLAGVVALGLASAGSVSATTMTDATDDFLPTFSGPRDADLDVTSFSVTYNSVTSSFLLGATLAGPIDSSKAGLYAIGVDTGTGPFAPFADVGAPNVIFNQVVVVRKDGTVLISGNSFSAVVPLALLPSTGFDPVHYGFNLWPRTGLGANDLISDFAPNNALISAAGVPEPASWAMMLVGFGIAGSALRRRPARYQTA